MRRVVSPLRGEARPRKRFCPPRTRSPHLNLSQPPFEAWCADPIHPHFHSGWQLGDAFVFPPLQPVHSPPASRMLGDTAVSLLQCTEPVPATCSTSLAVIPSKDAEGSPSRWRVPLLPGLLDTPSQVCLPLHDTMIPLSHFLHEWERLPGVSLWVLRTIRTGYTLQFGKNPPRFDGVHLTVVNSAAKASVLQQELSSLLQKGAIEEVPQSEVERGFFSRYFLVPKRDGGLRPILDLRRLNLSLYKGKFKMLTMRTIMSQVQEGDWFVTIGLKDAYFHIQVVHRHRRFLRFAFGGKAYQYKVLPFGLALAPRTFTKCMDAALAPLRLQGIRVLNYLDDWLILAHSRELVSRHRDIVLGHIHSLGLRMNAKKSVLLPSQRTVFLGVRLDSVQMQARLAPAQIPVFTACLARFKLGHHVSVGTCRRLLGLMAAASPVLPLGLLHMRPFLWWMKELRLHPTVPATRLVRVSRSCCRRLLMWRDPIFLRSGVRMGAIHRRHMITTDASMTGWGAVFEGRPESGRKSSSFWHINCLELRAVFLALDLSVVLEGLVTAPFEPLESASDRILTLKVVLLLALTSLKRVGDLQAFSVSETCMDFAPGLVKVTLRPKPGYIPKVLSTSFCSQVVTLHSFHPPHFASSEDERLHMLCPVRALKLYVDRSKVWRKSPQLLICFGAGRRGLATSKQRISHWVRDAISLAYEARELPSPLSLRGAFY